MGPRFVAGCGAIVRMNRPGFPETVLFEPPTVRGPAPAVSVFVERYGIGFTDIVKRPTAGSAELRPREFREGAARLKAFVGRLEPGVVWFQGALARLRPVHGMTCLRRGGVGRARMEDWRRSHLRHSESEPGERRLLVAGACGMV